MADGVWTMTEEGEFELNEPYATMLQEARISATRAWTTTLLGYLAEHTCYDIEFLKDELLPLDGKVDRVLCVAHSLILKALVRELAGSAASDAARKPIQRNCCVHILACVNGRFVLKETGRVFYDPALF